MPMKDHKPGPPPALPRVPRQRPVPVLGLLLVLLIAVASPGAAQTPTAEDWRNDLRFLVRELEIRHPNLYHTVSEERFKTAAESLEAAIPDLSDAAVVAGISDLLALVGDGHTGVLPFGRWNERFFPTRLPLEFYDTGEELLVIAAAMGHEELIGTRVTAFGNSTAAEALARIDRMTSKDNAYTNTATRERLALPVLMEAVGIVDRADRVRLQVDDGSGAQWVEVAAVPNDSFGPLAVTPPGASVPLWLARRDSPYSIAFLPDERAAFLQYNNAWEDREDVEWGRFCANIPDTLRARGVERLIIDLRWNAGGTYRRTDCLLHSMIRSEEVNRPGRLFVLINPNTFSAATGLAVDLDRHTEAIFVGRPTGGKPNVYSQRGLFHLPASGLEIRNSALYSQDARPEDSRPAVFPDRWVRLTAEAVRAGQDPALEVALSFQPLPSYVDEYLRAGPRGPVEALGRLNPRAAAESTRYEVSESELNAYGYELLGSGDTEAAISVFRAAIEAFPWSGNLHDSLGDAYRSSGDLAAARSEYCTAFAMNRDLRSSRENAMEVGGGQEACSLKPEGWAPLGEPWVWP